MNQTKFYLCFAVGGEEEEASEENGIDIRPRLHTCLVLLFSVGIYFEIVLS